MVESNQSRESIHIWADKIGIPRRFLGKELADLQGYESQIAKAAKAITNGMSVFITGACGTGKTHFAVGLLKLWHRATGKIPLFVPSVEFYAELKTAMDSEAIESDIIRKFTSTPLLALDDIGAEKLSDWSRNQFFLVIDRRYRNMQPVIVTSNLSLDAIAANIDDRLASRLAEMGEIVKLDGPDRRTFDSTLHRPQPQTVERVVRPPSEEERARVKELLDGLIKAPELQVKSVPQAAKTAIDDKPTVEKTPAELEAEKKRREDLKAQAERLKAVK